MDMQISSIVFDSFDEFLQWKEEEEIRTNSWYVQRCAPKQCGFKEHWYYYCNRAGKYHTIGTNKRCLKSQGTSKQISHCTSHIKATVNKESNVVTVEYNSTHYNHSTNLAHLRITDRSRQTIASKLRQGITPQRILDDIRDQHESRITRTHLVTKKDITNIRNQFNIEGIQKHKNYIISVSSWVDEMETLAYNPVVLFKQQGYQASELCHTISKVKIFCLYYKQNSSEIC